MLHLERRGGDSALTRHGNSPTLTTRFFQFGTCVAMKYIASILLFITLLSAALPARADLMLMEQPRKDYTWYGVLMLGLSIASLDVAQNGYTESDKALTKAQDSYKLYKAATTSDDANKYHKLTEHYRRRSVTFESTANAAVVVGVILGAAGVYSFFADGNKSPILVSYNSVTLRYHF